MSKTCSIIFSVAVTIVLVQAAICQTPAWNATIVSVSSDLPEYVSGDKWPGRPAGHRWVSLTVQLTSPVKDSKAAAASILIINKDGSYPVTAIGYQVKPKDSIVYLPLLILSTPHTDQGMKETKKEAPKVGGGWSTLSVMSPDRKRLDPVSVGFFEKMDIKKMLFNVLLKGESGGRELQLVKSQLIVVLLFAVPEGAANLQLKFGDAELVSVPGLP